MMRHVADSAAPPTDDAIARAARTGVTGWIGYLRSPYAADSWNPAELGRVLARAHLLPVYVGPYDAKTLRAMNPTRDAEQTLTDLDGINEPHHGITTVCLDIEPGAYAASPADVLDYFKHYRAELRAHGLDVAPYGAPGTLLGLGQHFNIGWVWCASWRAAYGRAPKPLWPTEITPPGLGNAWLNRRGWQQAGGPRVFGTRADLSVFPDDFPLIVHGAQPAPAPAPAPQQPPAAPPTIQVTVVSDGQTFTGRISRTS